jgi:8-oxo-dGTP diphosphatase
MAGEIRRYREERGMSAQHLADRCAALGLDISRSTLADLENGRRVTMNVAELLVLASALDVPPLLLIVPLGRAEATEILPGDTVDTWRAAKWLIGDGHGIPLRVLEDPVRVTDLFLTHDYYEREAIAAQYSADGARRVIGQAKSDDEQAAHSKTAEAYDVQARQSADALYELRKFMRRRGLAVPQLRWDWPAFARIEEQERQDTAATATAQQPVVAAIVTSARGVLAGRRRDGKPPWTFIAGEQEPGELPADTAVREVKEESGIEAKAGEVIGQRVHPKTGRTMIYLAARPARGTHVTAIVGDEAELAEVRWVATLDELHELMPDLYPPVRDYLARTLRGAR